MAENMMETGSMENSTELAHTPTQKELRFWQNGMKAKKLGVLKAMMMETKKMINRLIL